MSFRKRYLFVIIPLALAVILAAWYGIRALAMPDPPPPTREMLEQAKRVTIIRDEWGVPHVFGKTDGDAAFGLAYAHAEDDLKIIQLVTAASTGRLSLLLLSVDAIGNDFYVNLIRGNDQVDEMYDQLSPELRDVMDSYARGLSYYASLHPDEADGRLFPATGKDLAAGFVHKIPLMFNLPKVLGALNKSKGKKPGDPVMEDAPVVEKSARLSLDSFRMTASNTHAVSKTRFNDNINRLNVNSHQPWEGPVTWYEAHVVSEEGWNALGGTFPGAPFILHGHNDHLGWAHTNNFPDLVDVYRLVMNPEEPLQYRLDGKWKNLEERDAVIRVDIGIMTIPYTMKVYWSEHGPVFKTKHGFYAIRYAGIGRAIFAAEQWYRMNRAGNLAEWKKAMRIHALPMFNTGYADRDNIFFVYNALLPVRKPGVDYTKILPGDRSDLIWTEYLPWDRLPKVENPPSGYVQNCNSTPFLTTTGPGNPSPAGFAPEFGIDTTDNNRSMRSRRLLDAKKIMTRDDFLAMKFDMDYEPDAPIFTEVLNEITNNYKPENDDEKKGIKLLKKWDRSTRADNRGAALATLTWHPLKDRFRKGMEEEPDNPADAFREAVKFLMKHYNRLDPKLGEVQRLRRGDVDLPIGGGYDILSEVDTKIKKDKLVGYQGDSYICVAEFAPDGVISYTRHQYGNSNRPGSKHYADQAPHFVKRTLKRTYRDIKKLREIKEAEYHPGEELEKR